MSRCPALLSLCAVLAVLILPTLAPAAPPSPRTLRALDAVVTRDMRQWGVPGLALAVVQGGTTVHLRGFGLRDTKKGLPVTPDTIFPIGSCTKSFTGAALALLAHEGTLDLDAPVRRLLPDLRLAEACASEGLSVRDMLLHRTGLPRSDTLLVLRPDLTREEMAGVLPWLEASRPFRTAFQYSNLLYAVAGHVLEKASGRPYEAFVRERLLDPLDIRRTTFSVRDMHALDDVARPYRVLGGNLTEVPCSPLDGIAPAGAIASSVREMAKWIAANLRLGRVGDRQVLPEQALAETHRPQIVVPEAPLSPETPLYAYGLGWGVLVYRGHLLIMHDGETDGFRSSFSFMPDQGWGVAVLANRSDNSPLPGIVAFAAYDRLLGLPPIDWSRRRREAGDRDMEKARRQAEDRERETARKQAEAKDGAVSSGQEESGPASPLEAYAGTFVHPAYGTLSVAAGAETLTLTLAGETMPLARRDRDLFGLEIPGTPGVPVRFLSGGNNTVDRVSLPLEPGVGDIVFARAATPGTGHGPDPGDGKGPQVPR